AHQLRTPVAALRAQAELAQDEPDPQRHREILARIHTRSVGLSRLTDQLLNRAMIIHRADSVPNELLDLRSAAIRALDEFDPDGQQNIDLILPEDPVWVYGDAMTLSEACKNLLNNAVRYGTPPVSLHVSGIDGVARLQIRDAGSGLPESYREKIGRRFSRSGLAREDSAGIGLAIVDAVATAHGGKLEFGPLVGGFGIALALPEVSA
ncbi:MAG TPA: HAMP domain-containing sensor histidine kinase, partial [Paracoccaceae bacterium]|nr:HAMP domain-containing sensor histidine kinase [Paracoccaceae bacterium]